MNTEIARGEATVPNDDTSVVFTAVVPPGHVWVLDVQVTSPRPTESQFIPVVPCDPHAIDVGPVVGFFRYLLPDGQTAFAVGNTWPDAVVFDWVVRSL